MRLHGLPRGLAGTRVVHLSDFHLGLPSRGVAAVDRAIEWTRAVAPDFVVVTGDLVSRPRGEPRLRQFLDRVTVPCFAVLGNHDVAYSRDPFSRSAALHDLGRTRLLVDDAVTLELGEHVVRIVGVDPRTYRRGHSRPWSLADSDADLRILLCHFPQVLRRLPGGVFHLVLAGHMHDGQISLPLPRDKFRFAHPRARFTTGLYERAGTTMHVSPGLGTTFVPFRFYARPEATELVLLPAMPA